MDQQAYANILDQVRARVASYDGVDSSQVNAFFRRMTLQAFFHEGPVGFAMFTVDSEFIRDWVQKYFFNDIRRALKEMFGADVTVQIEVYKDQSAPNPAPSNAVMTQPVSTTPVRERISNEPIVSTASSQQMPAPVQTARQVPDPHHGEVRPHPAQSPSQEHDAQQIQQDRQPESDISPDGIFADEPEGGSEIEECTFENFVRGDSNNRALSQAIFVAENPVNTQTNPLFIYGESGLGKTHLLLAIKNYINQHDPTRNVIYVDTMDFVNEYVDAARGKDKKTSLHDIRRKYETADVLLMDDVQNLQRKSETLNMVFQILNTMSRYGRQIVLAADRQPQNIDIDERYRSRFSKGSIAQVYPPDFETKYGIIKSYVDECAELEHIPYHLSDEVMDYIARTAGPNIRDLKGGINDIISTLRIEQKDTISLNEVKSLLQDRLSATAEQRLVVKDIQKTVAKFYHVPVDSLTSKKRAHDIAHARQVAMYFSRVLLEKTEGDIGKSFNRDHSTVHHSIEIIKTALKDDRDLQEEIEVLEKMITGE